MIEETPPKRSFGIMRLFTSKPGAEKASAMKDPSHAMNRWGAIFGVSESSFFPESSIPCSFFSTPQEIKMKPKNHPIGKENQ